MKPKPNSRRRILTKKALKLALEALEMADEYGATLIIREALAQRKEPEQETVVFNTLASLKHKKTVGPIERAMLNTAPPKPEQEPEPDALTVVYMSGVFEGRKLEREACALIVENEAAQYAEPVWALEIVNDIRARGNT
jgi:hypothetical protein